MQSKNLTAFAVRFFVCERGILYYIMNIAHVTTDVSVNFAAMT